MKSAMFRSCIGALSLMLIMNAAHADSLFSKRTADGGALIASKNIRFKPGDLITVMVRETVTASTDSDLDTKKESSVESEADPADNSFISGRGNTGLGFETLPNWSIEAENEHKADGSTSRNNKLVMTVSCIVMEVFENGNVFVEGQKLITVNRENTMVKISGVVRSRDVEADNTVLSNQLANASIELTGKGPLWNNQRRGFITKLLDWFSPN